MGHTERSRPGEKAAPQAATATSSQPTPEQLADVYAWGAVFVADGAVSIAWLRGWAGAVRSRTVPDE